MPKGIDDIDETEEGEVEEVSIEETDASEESNTDTDVQEEEATDVVESAMTSEQLDAFAKATNVSRSLFNESMTLDGLMDVVVAETHRVATLQESSQVPQPKPSTKSNQQFDEAKFNEAMSQVNEKYRN